MRKDNYLFKLKDKLKAISGSLIILMSLIFIVSLWGNVGKIKSAEEKISIAQTEVNKLKEEGELLDKKLEEVKTDAFIEKQLRDKLGLAKEGEIVVVLPEDEILRKLAPKEGEEKEYLPDPNWLKWKKLFL